MRNSFNKLYIFTTAFLFLAAIFGGEAITRMNAPARGIVLAERVASDDKKDDTGGAPAQTVSNIFFDRSFLSIEESVILNQPREIGTQTKVTVARAAEPPRNVFVTDVKSGELVTITWDPFDAPPKTVLIFRSEGDGEAVYIGEAEGTALGYHDTDVKVGSRYSYTLESVSKDGEKSETTGTFTVGPIEDALPPTPPSDIIYTLGADGVTLRWSDPPAHDLAYISIFRSLIKGEAGEKIGTAPRGAEMYTDVEIEDGRTYYYFLKSEDENGNESANELVENRVGNSAIFTPVF